MNAYIWTEEQVSHPYGAIGFMVVIASSLEEARVTLRAFVEKADSLQLQETPEFQGGKEDYWKDYQKRVNTMRESNEEKQRELNKLVGVFCYELEPPGEWAGNCYSANWEVLLTSEPKMIIPLSKPMILAYCYGYEG